jgi:hypothetical protein
MFAGIWIMGGVAMMMIPLSELRRVCERQEKLLVEQNRQLAEIVVYLKALANTRS